MSKMANYVKYSPLSPLRFWKAFAVVLLICLQHSCFCSGKVKLYGGTVPNTYMYAKETCSVIGGELVTIYNAVMNARVAWFAFGDKTATEAWVGAQFNQSRNDYSWESGWDLSSWSQWQPNYPTNSTDACVCMAAPAGNWTDTSCTRSEFSQICAVDLDSEIAMEKAIVRCCWLANGLLKAEFGDEDTSACLGKCTIYFRDDAYRAWSDSRVRCVQLGGKLADPVTDDQFLMIDSLSRKLGFPHVWIDKRYQHYKWVEDGSPVVFPNSINLPPRPKDCIRMFERTWTLERCDIKPLDGGIYVLGICEKPY